MHKALTAILDIQELDMQMIQLMNLKKDRQRDLDNLSDVKADLNRQLQLKETEILELKKNARLVEGEVQEVVLKLKKLESQQNSIKKVEEFNALSQEMSQADREIKAKEQKASDMIEITPQF